MRWMAMGVAAMILIAASAARADIGASCCYCGKGFVLSKEGVGFARDYVGLCGECQKEIGDIDAYLKKLQGQFRGIADAAKLTNDRLKESLERRDKARDSIFGPKGSAVGFFKSLMSFAAQGAGGKFKKIADYTGKGIDYYNKAADTLKGDFKWVLDDGKEWVTEKAGDKAALKASSALARNYYARTKDARGSTELFLERHKQLKSGISFLSGAKSLYDNGNKLADGIQEYLEAREDSDRLYNEWDQLTEQMDDLLRRIGKLKHCRDGINKRKQNEKVGQSHGAGFVPAILALGMLQASAEENLAAPTAEERKALLARVKDETQPTINDLRTVQGSLQKMQADLQQLIRLFEEEIAPPLLPFWVDAQGEMGPELSLELLKWARPAAQQADTLFFRVEKARGNLFMYLRRTPGGGIAGSSRGHWVEPEARELIVMDDSPLKIKGKDGKEASLRLLDVDVAKKQARLWVGRQKEPVTINEGQTRRFDLDEDGTEDVEVNVKNLPWRDAMVADVKALRISIPQP